ncbi:hypothetical protein CEXT_278651, partial [Caerostris extrusa]
MWQWYFGPLCHGQLAVFRDLSRYKAI